MKPGAFDCYEAASDDEPIFVLRANDPLAPMTVLYWANAYRLRKELVENNGPMNESQRAKYDEARKCVAAMEVWYRDHAS